MASQGEFDDFFDAEDEAPTGPKLVVDLDGFEGPIDVLMSLAKEQKVDLVHISILQLADQYLVWVHEARRQNLELAADYLVMAAWLAYLKSRLLLPEPDDGEQPSGEEMAEALAFHLQRLEAMQEAGAALMARERLGVDFFPRGIPERLETESATVYDLTLFDLLKSYGDQQRKVVGRTMEIEPLDLYSVDRALQRLKSVLGLRQMLNWEMLMKYLPDELQGTLVVRSAIAATFTAALEMVREGHMELRQGETFGPIYVKGDPDLKREEGEGDNE